MANETGTFVGAMCRECGKPDLRRGSPLCRLCFTARERARYAVNKSVINAKRRDLERVKRAARFAECRCKECGEVLDLTADTGRQRCLHCRTRNNAATKQRDRKRRLQKPIWGMGAEPIHVGRHVAANIVRYLTVTLDFETYTAFNLLRQRSRERRIADCVAEGITDAATIAKRASTLFQTARHLRYFIKKYNHDFNHLPQRLRGRPRRGRFSLNFTFGADELTLGIVQHYAQDRNGNVSQTICDLICAAASPPATVDAPPRF